MLNCVFDKEHDLRQCFLGHILVEKGLGVNYTHKRALLCVHHTNSRHLCSTSQRAQLPSNDGNEMPKRQHNRHARSRSNFIRGAGRLGAASVAEAAAVIEGESQSPVQASGYFPTASYGDAAVAPI